MSSLSAKVSVLGYAVYNGLKTKLLNEPVSNIRYKLACATIEDSGLPAHPHNLIRQRRSQNAENVTHIKGILLAQTMILFNCVPFQMGTSLIYEQFLIVWKITFITLSDLPRMLLILLRTCVTCVMGARPV